MGTGSYIALEYNPAIKVYAPSKAADYYLTRALAKELEMMGPQKDGSQPDLIDVHTMAPTGTATNIMKFWMVSL